MDSLAANWILCTLMASSSTTPLHPIFFAHLHLLDAPPRRLEGTHGSHPTTFPSPFNVPSRTTDSRVGAYWCMRFTEG